MSHVVHDAGEDGGELLLAGARHDGLLVRAVLGPQRGQQRHLPPEAGGGVGRSSQD